MTASRRWPSAAGPSIQTPPASGPRHFMVAVMASITSRYSRRSRSKATQPVTPHMASPLIPRVAEFVGEQRLATGEEGLELVVEFLGGHHLQPALADQCVRRFR